MVVSAHLTGIVIVAIVVLGPIWLSLHYRARRLDTRPNGEVIRKLDELTDLAGRMQARIEALERLLEPGPAKGVREP